LIPTNDIVGLESLSGLIYSIPASAESPPVLPQVDDSLGIPNSMCTEYFRPKSDGDIGDLLSPDKTAHMWTAGRGRGVHGGFEKAKLWGSGFFPYCVW
jgi:hypothetical protein